MTEQEWLNYPGPYLTPMLDFLRDKVSDRKLQLFALACYWRAAFDGSISPDPEKYAHGEATLVAIDAGAPPETFNALLFPEAIDRTAFDAVRLASADALGVAFHRSLRQIELAAQKHLLADIIGPVPFRPVSVALSCRIPAVTALAQAIYADHAFDRLTILADVLEEAGCISSEILNHLRLPGEHVRGCWALDLVLGKE